MIVSEECAETIWQHNLYDLNTEPTLYLWFVPLAEERSIMVWRNELSDREREVSDLISRGFSNGQIAKNLDISEPTVKTHLRNIFAHKKAHHLTICSAGFR